MMRSTLMRCLQIPENRSAGGRKTEEATLYV